MTCPLSVVIPTYNRAVCLERCVASVLSQLQPTDEIIVVDQKPSTTTAIRKRFPQIRFVDSLRPNLPAARNAGCVAAVNAVVVFIDDDAVAGSGWLDAHRRARELHPLNTIGGRIHQADGTGWSGEAITARIDPGSLEAVGNFDLDTSGSVAYASGGNLSVPRQRALAIGGFNPRFRGNALFEDVDFCLRFRAAGGAITYEPSAQIEHRPQRHGGCRTLGGTAYLVNRIHNWLLFCLIHDSLWPRRSVRIHLRNLVEFATRTPQGTRNVATALACVGVVCRAYFDASLSRGSGKMLRQTFNTASAGPPQ